MGKFSDSPYFLLKDFFTGKGNLYKQQDLPILDYEWPTIWTDYDYVTFNDYDGVIWNLRYYYDPNRPNTDGSYLVGLETNIVTKGDGLIELWVKETDEPYKQFLPITLRYKLIDVNNFVFTDKDLCGLLPGDKYENETWPLTGNAYYFDLYDGACTNYAELINNDRETYFRKDSIYHEWLVSLAPDYYNSSVLLGGRGHDTSVRNYTNSDTIFSYFGKIFKDVVPIDYKEIGYNQTQSNEFRIIFDGMKDFIRRAVPSHQRTDNFMEFMEVFFDRKWHEIYNQLKNIWTLFDPMEVDEDFIGYLSKYYHMKDLIAPSLLRQREFVRDLIWLLKRKGTYVEFYIIWRAIANTTNALNIYEKWHERDIIERQDTHVRDDEWQEYIYVEKPEYRYDKEIGGADIGWYNRTYDLSGNSIVDTTPPSAFYNYPVKINNNPLTASEYIPSGGINIPNIDVPLPVYQVDDTRILSTHYKIEIDVSSEPLLPDAIVNQQMWDELWQYWDYLRPVNRVVDYNILIAPITDFSGCFVELYEFSGNAFDKTRVMVDLRSFGGWISPHIKRDDYWPSCSPSGSLSGSLSGTSYGESPSGGCRWVVKHPLSTKYLHTMAVNESYTQIVPDSIELVDDNTVVMSFDTPTYGYAVLKRSQKRAFGGNPTGVWQANHYIYNNEVITEAHAVNNTEPDFKLYGNMVDNTGLSAATFVIEDTGDNQSVIVPASSGDFVLYVDPPSGDYQNAAWVQPMDQPMAVWEIPHHLYYRGVITAVYDWDNNQIHQYEFELAGIDRAVLKFDSPISGYAIFIPVANFSLEQLIDDFTDILRNGAHWEAGVSVGDIQNGTVAASGDIQQTEIYETDDFIYINIKLGAEIEGSFREFGIYNSHGDLMVYSKSSEIYKPYGTTLVLHFRLEKKADHECGSGGYVNREICG